MVNTADVLRTRVIKNVPHHKVGILILEYNKNGQYMASV